MSEKQHAEVTQGSVRISFTTGDVQLLSRIIDTVSRDSYPEKDASVTVKEDRARLDHICCKLQKALRKGD